MQAVYDDGSLGDMMPYDEEKIKKLLEQTNVDHVEVFDLKKRLMQEMDQLKDEDKETKPDKEELKETVREVVKEELDRRETMSLYEQLKAKEVEILKAEHREKMANRGIDFNRRNFKKL